MVNGKVLEQRSRSEVLGDINPGKTARKGISNSNGSHFCCDLLPSSSTADFTTDDTFTGFELEIVDPNQAIAKAKEQFCHTMEVKEEEDMQQWMEQ